MDRPRRSGVGETFAHQHRFDTVVDITTELRMKAVLLDLLPDVSAAMCRTVSPEMIYIFYFYQMSGNDIYIYIF
jgi:hypothetical protein